MCTPDTPPVGPQIATPRSPPRSPGHLPNLEAVLSITFCATLVTQSYEWLYRSTEDMKNHFFGQKNQKVCTLGTPPVGPQIATPRSPPRSPGHLPNLEAVLSITFCATLVTQSYE